MDDIIKQGWLRRAPNPENNRPLSSFLLKVDSPKWCLLVVRQNCPYFEAYNKEDAIFSESKQFSINLSRCQKVSYVLSKRTKVFSFCLVFSHKIVQFQAPSRDHLVSWVSAIETCLDRLGILKASHDEHIYSFCPAVVSNRRHPGSFGDGEELEGAVGGTNNLEVDEPIYASAEDSEDKIFGTLNDSEISELRRKASDGDIDSAKILAKFEFDWMKEPTSQPIYEMSTAAKGEDTEDVSGSSDFVDPFFWDQIQSKKDNDKSNSDKKANDNSDSDGEYCGISELAQARGQAKAAAPPVVKRRQVNGPSSKTSVVNSSSNEKNKDSLTVLLPSCSSEGTSCSQSSENSSKKTDNENLYAPFPIREALPDLIDFSVYGLPDTSASFTAQPSAAVDVSSSPLPKPPQLTPPDIKPRTKQNVTNTNLSQFSVTNEISNQTVNGTEGVTQTLNVNSNLQNQNSFVTDNNQPVRKSEQENQYISMNRGSVELSPESLPTQKPPVEDVYVENDKQNEYEGIFEKEDLNSPAPDVPQRTDSLALFDVRPKQIIRPYSVTSPSVDPDFDYQIQRARSQAPVVPPLPPRQKIKSEELPPPIPSRGSKSVRLKRADSSPGSETGEVSSTRSVPSRQLSTRMRLDKAQTVQTVISLKQNQIEILKEEMLLPSVTVEINKKWFAGVALVDCFNSVWVAGWNINEYPRLHNKFHIGDKVISLNNVPVESTSTAMKQIKNSDYQTVTFVIKRLPRAKVFVIRRSAEGENLGIKREGGTPEIVYVNPDGLAGKEGLHLKTKTMNEDNLCNWFITEINSRPLNLFFKEMEVEHRLGAVGKDISLVVQPSDLIMDMKKQLKKLRNYKSYLIK